MFKGGCQGILKITNDSFSEVCTNKEILVVHEWDVTWGSNSPDGNGCVLTTEHKKEVVHTGKPCDPQTFVPTAWTLEMWDELMIAVNEAWKKDHPPPKK
jgi:hypothetical protein